MDLPIKEISLTTITCNICFREIEYGMINKKVYICNNCNKEVSLLDIDDIKYMYYKNKIKTGLINKYKLD